MIACRAECAHLLRLLATGLAALPLLLAAAGDGARAQTGMQGAAEPRPAATGAPLPLFPQAAPAPRATAAPAGGVKVDRLGGGVDSLGVLGPGEGGFGPDLWRGSDRETVEHLLARLPVGLNSPSLMEIARRLLLSNAAPPLGEGQGLLALRAERLLALGDPAAARRLIAAAPSAEREEGELARLDAEAALAAGDRRAACAAAPAGLVRRPDQLFWRRLLLVCEIAARNETEAMMAFDLLRESGGEEEGAFLALAAAALGLGAPPEVSGATPLELTLMALAGTPPPAAILEGNNAAELAVVARQAEFPLASRLSAGERAAEGGTLGLEELRALYAAFDFAPAALASAAATAEDLPGPEGRALLLAALEAVDPPGRPPLLARLLASARDDGLELALSALLAEELAAVSLAPELAWLAEEAARALYLAGRSEAAAAWRRLAEEQGRSDPELKAVADRLAPLAFLSGETGAGLDPAAWSEASLREGDPDAVADQLAQVAALARGLGLGLDMSWSRLVGSTLAPEPLGDAPALFALEEAAAADRLGESLLLVLRLVGEEGPGETHLVALTAALAALTRFDLRTEARRLACEAAALRGL